MRDNQRAKVYAMEARLYGQGSPVRMGKREARQFFKRVCRGLEIEGALALKFRRGGVRNFYRQGEQSIHMMPPVLKMSMLHEIGHYLARARFGNTIAGHGPEFVGILIALLILFDGYDSRRAFVEASELVIGKCPA